MTPPHRQSVAQISAELGIHVANLYNWRKAWRLQGEVVPASEKEPEAVTVRKRTSTPEHALASETPTAMSKGLCQTGHGDVRP